MAVRLAVLFKVLRITSNAGWLAQGEPSPAMNDSDHCHAWVPM
jgi:hypothetical protein